MEVTRPLVMGIINATPDSYFSNSRVSNESEAARRAEKLLAEGADMIDLGACSTRPGAKSVDAGEELSRLTMAMRAIRSVCGEEVKISIDTFRADVARKAVEDMDADMVNDISAGKLDAEMIATVAKLRVPYIAMHMRGTPENMQQFTDYGTEGVAAGVVRELSSQLSELELAGVADVIVDPGFGFAKTPDQNYELMNALPHVVETLRRPVLVGISRKSMLTRMLGIDTADALAATTALHFAALERGASILRCHDAREARQAVDLYLKLTPPSAC